MRDALTRRDFVAAALASGAALSTLGSGGASAQGVPSDDATSTRRSVLLSASGSDAATRSADVSMAIDTS